MTSLLLFQGERGRPGPQGPKGESGLKVSSPAPVPAELCAVCRVRRSVSSFTPFVQYLLRHHGSKASLSGGWIGLRTRIKTLCGVLGQANVCSHFPRRSVARGPAVTWEPL